MTVLRRRHRSLLQAAQSAACVQSALGLRRAPNSGLYPFCDAGTGATRRYFIAANVVKWDYTPSGLNQCQGRPFSAEESVYARGGNSSTYLKAQYTGYSDGTLQDQAGEFHA